MAKKSSRTKQYTVRTPKKFTIEEHLKAKGYSFLPVLIGTEGYQNHWQEFLKEADKK